MPRNKKNVRATEAGRKTHERSLELIDAYRQAESILFQIPDGDPRRFRPSCDVEDVFSALIELHSSFIHYIYLGYVQRASIFPSHRINDEDLDSIYRETLLQCVRYYDRSRSETVRFQTYLGDSLYNAIRKETDLRSRKYLITETDFTDDHEKFHSEDMIFHPESREVPVEDRVLRSAKDVVDDAMNRSRLDDRDRMIFHRRFMCDRPDPLDRIGRELKITKERVRQVAERAKERVRLAILRGPYAADFR
jgi:RNA polymerase sigma factor (sigma-70 family)